MDEKAYKVVCGISRRSQTSGDGVRRIVKSLWGGGGSALQWALRVLLQAAQRQQRAPGRPEVQLCTHEFWHENDAVVVVLAVCWPCAQMAGRTDGICSPLAVNATPMPAHRLTGISTCTSVTLLYSTYLFRPCLTTPHDDLGCRDLGPASLMQDEIV